MPVREFLRKFSRSTINRIETLLRYTANRQRSSRNKRPSSGLSQRVQTPPESPQPKDRRTRRKQITSIIDYQWCPRTKDSQVSKERSSSGRPHLTVRNPDLDDTVHIPGDEVTESDDSNESDDSGESDDPDDPEDSDESSESEDPDDSGDSDDSDDSDLESLEFDGANRSQVARPSSRLAKIIEEDYSEIFPDGFITSSPAIAIGQDSVQHAAERPVRHVTWNLPSSRKHTFQQRMTDKLQARKFSPGSSHRHRHPPRQSSREAHKPRSILKPSTGPPLSQTLVHELGLSPPQSNVDKQSTSQPKTLVHKKAYRNLPNSVPVTVTASECPTPPTTVLDSIQSPAPIITVTPPDCSTPPPTTVLDFIQSPEGLNALPALLYRNPNRSMGSETNDPFTVVGRSEPLRSHPKISNFVTLSSAPIADLPSLVSTPSPVFVTAPSCPDIRKSSLPSSLQISIPGKRSDPKVQIEAQRAVKKAEVVFLTKELNHARRELNEVETALREIKRLGI